MTEFLRRFTAVSYVVALTFIIAPIVDAATNAWPWFMGSEQWRFGAVAILSNYLISIVFGLLFLGAVGVARAAQGTLYFVTVFSGLLSLLLLVMIISYAFDSLQLWGSVREEQREMFQIGAIKTLFKIALYCIGTLMMAIAAFKGAKDAKVNSAAPALIRPT